MVDYRDNNNWTVYVHIVPKELSGYDHDKYYVGVTSKKTNERFGKDGIGYKTQYFYKAILKYGWSNIKHEIIAKKLTHNEACEMEKVLINKLNSNDSKYGYNLTLGGEGTVGIHNCGEKNPFYNKTHTEETKRKMSLYHYDCSGDKNPSAKKVINITDGIVYRTIKDANKATGFTECDSHISAVCRGKRKSAGKNKDNKKIVWMYYDEYLNKYNLKEEEEAKELFFFN